LVPELQRHSAETEEFRFDEATRRNTETMDRTVREHLDDLEQKLLALNDRMMDERDVDKRNELEAELRAVQSAVVLYRSALEVESRLSRN
jgi:hypothetical protein